MSLLRLLGADVAVPATLEPGQTAVELTDVGYRVGSRWLVRRISLQIRVGEVLAVVGPNGAGKSTLLALAAGDLAPTTGRVQLVGCHDASVLQLARRRAVLTQQHAVSFPFSVTDVVSMGRAPWAGTAAEADDDAAVAAALTRVELASFSDRLVPTLSGGEQARTAFARVLAQDAQLMLLDEPTAALDIKHQESAMRQAGVRADAGAAVAVVVHDLQLAAAYADRIALLHDGRLLACGPPLDVLDPDLLSHAYDAPIRVAIDAVTEEITVAPVRPGRRSR